MTEPREETERVKHHMGIFGQLKKIRQPHETYWDEQIEFASPTRGRIMSDASQQSLASPIIKKAVRVYSTTAQQALKTQVDGYQGSVVGRSIDWLALKISHQISFARTSALRYLNGKRLDEIPEVRQWLAQKKEVYYSAFNYSNFYDTLGPMIGDAAVVGHGTLYVEEDKSKGQLVFTTIHPREGYLGDNRFDKVDTYYRYFKWTLLKMVEKFGMDKLTEIDTGFKQQFEKNYYSEEEIYHFIFPRRNIEMYTDAGGTVRPKAYAANKKWASLWIWKNRIVLDSGFDFLPVLVWRWGVGTGELYGWCPTSAAIVDILTDNQVAKDLLHATHMATDPMWNIPEEMRKEFNYGPRAFNYYKGQDRVASQVQNKANIPIGMEEKNEVKRQVEGHYDKDFWFLLSQAAMQGTEMTAYQAMQIVGERALLMSAKIGRFYSEAMDPLIDIVDAIETSAGRMPEPPDILMEFSGANIDVQYCGPLAQAQKAAMSRPAIAGMQAVTPFLDIFPEARVRIDGSEFVAGILRDIDSFPPKAIRSDEQVQQIMQQQQQAAEQAQQAEQMTQMMKTVPGMGKPVDSTSPMAAMMGGEA